MPRLTNDIKRFIVMELATLRTPAEVSARIGEEFDLEVTPQQVHEYDPTKAHGAGIAKKWRDLYDVTNAEFMKSAGQIPIAIRAYRLRELYDLYQRHKRSGNLVAAAAVLEQAAKEMGQSYTNRHEVSGPKGGPIGFRDYSHMTIEQLDAEIIRLLGGAGDDDATDGGNG